MIIVTIMVMTPAVLRNIPHASGLFHTIVYPCYEICIAASRTLCFDMLLPPYGCKINGFHFVIILKCKSKVYFCCK